MRAARRRAVGKCSPSCLGANLRSIAAHRRFTRSRLVISPRAADVIRFARTCRARARCERRAVILDVQPVAHVEAVAVDRQRLAHQRVDDHQRNELLGKLIGSVIIEQLVMVAGSACVCA